jgi:hypothetical protein
VQQAQIIVRTCDQGNVQSTPGTKVHPSLFLDAKVKANREYNDYCHPLNRTRQKTGDRQKTGKKQVTKKQVTDRTITFEP